MVERFTPDRAGPALCGRRHTLHSTTQGRSSPRGRRGLLPPPRRGLGRADHLRSELQMAIWNHRPDPGAVHHCDHGLVLHKLGVRARSREAGLLGSLLRHARAPVRPRRRVRVVCQNAPHCSSSRTAAITSSGVPNQFGDGMARWKDSV